MEVENTSNKGMHWNSWERFKIHYKFPLFGTFSASNHGGNVCDADASHIKTYIRRLRKAPDAEEIATTKDLCAVADKVFDAHGKLINVDKTEHRTTKMTGISKLHKITFDFDLPIVRGYDNYYSVDAKKEWELSLYDEN